MNQTRRKLLLQNASVDGNNTFLKKTTAFVAAIAFDKPRNNKFKVDRYSHNGDGRQATESKDVHTPLIRFKYTLSCQFASKKVTPVKYT
jgi:hypothetical protein